MPSRGVLLGDVHRANDMFNERLAGLDAGHGTDTEQEDGHTAAVNGEAARMLHADIFDEVEARIILTGLVKRYTSMTGGAIFEILVSMASHAAAVGTLTERQRWDETGVSPVTLLQPQPGAPLAVMGAVQALEKALLEGDRAEDYETEVQILSDAARAVIAMLGGGTDGE